MKSLKALVTGVAAQAAWAAAFGVTALAPVPAGSAPQVRLAAVGVPSGPALPQDPPPAPAPSASGANIPTPVELMGLLNSLADPSVPFANKSNLVEGGISGTEAHIADHELKKAASKGDLPLTFDVANIQPAAAGSATADVSVSGPKLANPVTQNVTFVNQGSWMLSRASAMQLLQAAGH